MDFAGLSERRAARMDKLASAKPSISLAEVDAEIKSLESKIEAQRYAHLPSEVEPGTTHKIKLDDRELAYRTQDLQDALKSLRDYRRFVKLREDLDNDSRKRNVEHKPEVDLPPLSTNLEDFLFADDLSVMAARRAARMTKIAQCSCMDADDEGDYMAEQNMRVVVEQSVRVLKMLKEEEHLDDWLEDKISKLTDDMDEVYKYLAHGDR